MEIKSERRCKAFKNDRPASISTVFSKAAKACRSIILIFILLSGKDPKDVGHNHFCMFYFLLGGVPYIFGVTRCNFGLSPSIFGSANHWYSPSPSKASPLAQEPLLLSSPSEKL